MGVLRALVAMMLLASPVMGRGRVVVVETKIEILDDIHWVGHSAVPMIQAQRTLDAVAQTMRDNPALHVEVVGFGSDLVKANPVVQVGLGKDRADTIVSELVRRGIDHSRLSATAEAKPRHGQIDPVPLFVIVTR